MKSASIKIRFVILALLLIVAAIAATAITIYLLLGYYYGFDITNILLQLILVAVVVSIIAAVVLVLATSKTIKPLQNLAESAKQIAKGNINVNPIQGAKGEIKEVCDAFGEVLSSLHLLDKNFANIEINIKKGITHYQCKGEGLHGFFKKTLDTANNIAFDFSHALDLIAEPIILIDHEKKITHVNKGARKITGTENATWDELVGMPINKYLNGDIAGHPATVKAYTTKKAEVEYEIALELAPSKIYHFEYNCFPYEHLGVSFGSLLLLTNITHIKHLEAKRERQKKYQHERVENFTDVLVGALEGGDLAMRFPESACDEETRDIASEQNEIENVVEKSIHGIKIYVDEITNVLRQIADNNFDVKIYKDFVGDFNPIKQSIGMIVQSVSSLIDEIQTATSQVESGAELIAQSTTELMTSFERQNFAMGEAKKAVIALTEKTQKNAQDLQEAGGLAALVQEAADEGSKYMSDMSVAMDEIKQSSNEIAKVVSVIDSIAFQTNLLALNASVEAARAGVHGAGFSVVADEVRTLAARSAAAAKNTSEMIKESLSRVDEGVEKSIQTTEALRKIVELTDGTSAVMSNIASASIEQAAEISRIQNTMSEIYSATADNNNAVQSNASVSEELSSQSIMLNSLVSRFKISK